MQREISGGLTIRSLQASAYDLIINADTLLQCDACPGFQVFIARAVRTMVGVLAPDTAWGGEELVCCSVDENREVQWRADPIRFVKQGQLRSSQADMLLVLEETGYDGDDEDEGIVVEGEREVVAAVTPVTAPTTKPPYPSATGNGEGCLDDTARAGSGF